MWYGGETLHRLITPRRAFARPDTDRRGNEIYYRGLYVMGVPAYYIHMCTVQSLSSVNTSWVNVNERL